MTMNSAKEALRSAIESLSDEEAQQTLEFIQALQKQSHIPWTLRRLAGDPTFKIPSECFDAFATVEPLQGKGVAASRLLIEDRR
jgi:hypothetical protein